MLWAGVCLHALPRGTLEDTAEPPVALTLHSAARASRNATDTDGMHRSLNDTDWELSACMVCSKRVSWNVSRSSYRKQLTDLGY